MAKGKQGRVPSSKREQAQELDESFEDFSDLEFNVLGLDDDLKKELDDKGLVPRWINAAKYTTGGNFHKSGWRAYRRESGESRGNTDFVLGTSPEGYVIRNDLMLAVKSREDHKRWGKRIAQLTRMQSGQEADGASTLRRKAQDAGVSVQVHEGYDENGDDGE